MLLVPGPQAFLPPFLAFISESQAYWFVPMILVLRRLRQGFKFKPGLGYILRLQSRNKIKKEEKEGGGRKPGRRRRRRRGRRKRKKLLSVPNPYHIV